MLKTGKDESGDRTVYEANKILARLIREKRGRKVGKIFYALLAITVILVAFRLF